MTDGPSDLATQHAQIAQENAKGDSEKDKYGGLIAGLMLPKLVDSAGGVLADLNKNVGGPFEGLNAPVGGGGIISSLTPEVSGPKILGEKVRFNINADSAAIIGQAAAQAAQEGGGDDGGGGGGEYADTDSGSGGGDENAMHNQGDFYDQPSGGGHYEGGGGHEGDAESHAANIGSNMFEGSSQYSGNSSAAAQEQYEDRSYVPPTPPARSQDDHGRG